MQPLNSDNFLTFFLWELNPGTWQAWNLDVSKPGSLPGWSQIQNGMCDRLCPPNADIDNLLDLKFDLLKFQRALQKCQVWLGLALIQSWEILSRVLQQSIQILDLALWTKGNNHDSKTDKLTTWKK